MSVHLHIERLVLDGLPSTTASSPALRRALQRQLAGLLAQSEPLLHDSFAVPSLGAPPLPHTALTHPVHAGQQIAQSLHAALVPNRKGDSQS